MRTLAIDTASAACSVALFDGDHLLACAHELVGRGHEARLIPMVAGLPDGGRAERILVDVGPGSFTGLRVGIAAARALALGWSAGVSGYSSLPLIAAAHFAASSSGDVAVCIEGGHGEVFMQSFAADPLTALDDLASLPPAAAAARVGARTAIGTGVRWLAELRPAQNGGEPTPDASFALLLPPAFRDLPPRPLYGRAPDAKPPR